MDDSDEYEFEVDSTILPWLETPLDPRYPCIRILKLHPSVNDNPLTCSLHVVSLDDNPYYETLSYVWGDPEKTRPIIVGGEVFNATNNLVDFLQCLRHKTSTRFLWADAICIDQSNVEEKGRQIGLMSRIYRQAKEAHIWFGHFTQSWTDEIRGDTGEYTPACELASDQWIQMEKWCDDELGQFLHAGGTPAKQQELLGLDSAIMSQTMNVLDEVAGGKHFHEFPLFFAVDGEVGRAGKYAMNRHWFTIHDCFRWLLSRPWWTRVWTIQEAVVPRFDPIVHADPYTFRLSRLLKGRKAILDHSNECCRRLNRLFTTPRSLFIYEIRSQTVYEHREIFSELDPPWIPLKEAIDSARGRNATAAQDHFYGIFALLHPELQQNWFATFGYSCTTTEIFSQCSKLLYSDCQSLLRLGEARGVRESKIPGLPSWAIDLSAEVPLSFDGNGRWKLFNASPQPKFPGFDEWQELTGPDLLVQAIPIGTVGACAKRLCEHELDLVHSPRGSDMILKYVSEWQQLYANWEASTDSNKFWRTAFMDRNIWWYYMHKRKPLPLKSLTDIKQWWRNWKETGDPLDLTIDTRSADNKRGDYHYRALKLNFEKHRFFCTIRGEPGMGPMEAQSQDELFVFRGCPAPAVLRRRIAIDGEDDFLFIGFCFVDAWMYEGSRLGRSKWQIVKLC